MIKIENLEKKFGKLTVLKNITAEINKGEVIAIIGPSGTGKSTLLRCLNLLEQPTGGKIYVDGTDILCRNTDVPKMRQRMGMVFQSFNLFHHLTVLENLTIGPIKLLKKKPDLARSRGLELLKLVGLAEKAESFADELSGGQKQRIAIARCLSMDPEIILFDEPTSALDPTMVSEVLAVIRRLAKAGMTMAVVTHEMDFARDVANRVFYMDEGMIYEDGPPSQIFGNPLKEKTRAFINRIRSFNYHIDSPDYDFYGMNGEISNFCEKHVISKNATNNLLLVIEEIIELYKIQHRKIEAHLTVAYSEKSGSLEVIFKYQGDKLNILEYDKGSDDLSRKIIENFARTIQFTHQENENILNVILKL